MNAFCDGIDRCQREQHTASLSAGKSFGKLLRQSAMIAAVLALGGCSWFEDDEPAFPPSTGGPNIAAVPNGLLGDSADAQYSDQELRALLESAPRPLPPPPAPPKTADIAAPGDAKPEANTNPATDSTTSTQPSGTPTAPAVPDAATNNPNAYPDINTVPMQRPTPVPDNDQPPIPAPESTPAGTPAGSAPAVTPDKPKQSSMLTPLPGMHGTTEQLLVLTTAGSSPSAPTQLADQSAQSVANSDDDMFSKPVLPPYSGYDQLEKQPQGVPAQSLYRSPYTGPTELGQPAANAGGSVVYAAQTDSLGGQSGSQIVASPNGQPVGLVYFGAGSTQLGGSDRQVLHQIAALQQAYGGVIRIVGHASSRTDNMPMDEHQKTNANIAEARAKSVALQLVHYGVRPLFVQIAGASDTQPLYPEIMPAGEAANRRAEIYLSSN
jgi:flagellar motor protein MotB